MSAEDFVELTLSQLKKVLKDRFIFQLKNPDDRYRLRPLYVEGHAGIGKTQLMRQVAKELAAELKEPVLCQVLNLQFCERPDFMGLPRITSEGETTFARPKILPKSGLGILLLDEANRVDSDIQSGMLTLLEDRNINGHELGQSWMIVLAGNPAGSANQYRVGEFDFALQDRIAKVRAQGNLEDLLTFFQLQFSDHVLLKFLDFQPDFISFDGVGCTPRSFEYAMRATLGLTNLKDPLFFQGLSIELGTQAATHILKILESGYIPTLKNILKRDPRVYKYLDNNFERQDVMFSLIDQIYTFVCTNADKNAAIPADDVSAIVEFLMLVQNEHRVALFEKIRGSKYSIYFGQAFLKNTRLAEVLYARRASNS